MQFMKNYYTIHDYENHRVGLIEANVNAGSLDAKKLAMIIFLCFFGLIIVFGCLYVIYAQCIKKKKADPTGERKAFGGKATSLGGGRCNCLKRFRRNRGTGSAVAANTFKTSSTRSNDEEQLLDQKAQQKREEIAAARLKNLIKKDTQDINNS